jgi:hypothetical protein
MESVFVTSNLLFFPTQLVKGRSEHVPYSLIRVGDDWVDLFY